MLMKPSIYLKYHTERVILLHLVNDQSTASSGATMKDSGLADTAPPPRLPPHQQFGKMDQFFKAPPIKSRISSV